MERGGARSPVSASTGVDDAPQLTAEEREAAGIKGDMVCISVGIEDPADIVADLEAAIESASGN